MSKNLVFLRTHYINDAVISEYDKLNSSLDESYRCLLFIDNHKNIISADENEVIKTLHINGTDIDAFLYNEKTHKILRLPYYAEQIYNSDFSRVMWYCSDYPLYVIRRFFPDYDYYWSLENDIFCNGNSYKPFFDNYMNNKNDLIISFYRDASDEDWEWKNQTDWCYKHDKIYASFFPVVRVSARAVDFLYQKRLEHAKIIENLLSKSEISNVRWIFCETFVPTELTNNGFKCESLDEPYIRHLPVYNLNLERIFEKPNFRLYHPVK